MRVCSEDPAALTLQGRGGAHQEAERLELGSVRDADGAVGGEREGDVADEGGVEAGGGSRLGSSWTCSVSSGVAAYV